MDSSPITQRARATERLRHAAEQLQKPSLVRVVLRWNGRKAYGLRIAMRMTVREFAAKLGQHPDPWPLAAVVR